MKAIQTILASAAVVLLFSATIANATIVTFQDGATYTGTEDNTLVFLSSNSAYETKNYGGSADFTAGHTGAYCRGLIRFDVESLDGQFTQIDSVKLKLKTKNAGDVSIGGTLELYRLISANKSWVEGTGNGTAAQTNESCWNYRNAPSTTWNSGGTGASGGTVTSDYENDGSSGYIASAGFLSTIAIDDEIELTFTGTQAFLTGIISTWAADNGDNPGLVLRVSGEANGTKLVFYSSDYGSTEAEIAKRPMLTIDYTPIPEPATMVLLGLGGVGLLIRRRRRA